MNYSFTYSVDVANKIAYFDTDVIYSFLASFQNNVCVSRDKSNSLGYQAK